MRQSGRLLVASLVLLVCATVHRGQLSAQNGTPPGNVSLTFDVNVGDPFGSCAFPIRISAQGKGKTIQLPSGNFISTSPGLDATVINLDDPTNQVTLNITGSFHVSTDPDGSTLFVVTGRNLLADPIAGIVLAIGDFSFAFDAAGGLIQPLTAQGGTLVDVCALIQ
jgi:hypothetical protein